MSPSYLTCAAKYYQDLQVFDKKSQLFCQPSERQLTAFADYLAASERQANYLTTLATLTESKPHYWSPKRADINSGLFDPIKAILYLKHIDLAEAIWLAFLVIHVGDTPQSGWHYLKMLYGNHGKAVLSWAAVSQQPDLIEQWINTCEPQPLTFKFGKHRKYESVKQLYQVIQSYHDWLTQMGGIEGLIQSNDDPMTHFAKLYQTMRIYRFGRLAKFEFLSLLGYLDILPIKADHCYLSEATGPKRGAKLLFGSHIKDRQLDTLAVATADALAVDYAVFEAALCHWQSSPNYAPNPDNLP